MQPKQCADNEPAKYTYPIQMTNPFERESWLVATDHCYARPWNWKSDSAFLKPTKTLFVCKNNSKQLFSNATCSKEEDDIDVESLVEPTAPTYDIIKAKTLMEECERHAAILKQSSDENWEEKVSKANWTPSQYRLFNSFVNILNSYNLGKLAQSGVNNEPILRRTIIDKAVQRVRRLFASVSYEWKLLQWLHQLLLDNLDQENLGSYLNIIQTLKVKLPKLVDNILVQNQSSRIGSITNENLLPVMKKPWDPVASSLIQDKPKKLPGNPVLILVPCAPFVTKRYKRWMSLLSHLGQVISVPNSFGSGSQRMTMTNCIDQMFALTRGRVQEVRESCPNRYIILVGIGAGAALALQVAQVENIFCVVSLGFSLYTVEGKRGEPDDSMLELQCPVLFVIGQCSSTALQEDMEDLRERMRVETGFIVVGSANNNLIVNKKKKRQEGITQSIVDRCITDEIGEFISSLILSPFPPQIRQSPTNISLDTMGKKSKNERKRYNSTTSSIESEPPSPTPKLTRPVGRPTGKIKSRQWINQDPSDYSNPPMPSNSITFKDINAFTPISSDALSALDTTSFNNSSPQKHDSPQPIKKIKTLKPVTIGDPIEKVAARSTLKHGDTRMPFSVGRTVVSSQLSNLLQSGVKTLNPMQSQIPTSSSTIKVLENVQLSNQATAKLISSPGGCPIDLSKLGLTTTQKSNSSLVLLPDGKIKSINTGRTVSMKGQGGVVLSVSQGKIQPRKNKYIISKRFPSTIGSRGIKRDTYVPLPPTVKTTLPPPTDLSTQDIMDLPIIFADDDQILDSNVPTDLSTNESSRQTMTKFVPPLSTNKYVIVTKPTSINRSNPVPVRQPTKYTKIILSKKPASMMTSERIPSITRLEHSEIESELVETREGTLKVQNLNVDTKQQFNPRETIQVDDDDPDYIPPKNLKL